MNEPAKMDLSTAKIELAKFNGTFPNKLQKLLGGPAFEGMPESVVSIWRSSTHLVTLHQHEHCLVLEIRRTVLTDEFEFESDPMTWSELMAVKAEIGMGDGWAVEVYPPVKHSLKSMASRCLWIMQEEPDFGWRLVSPDTERAKINGHSLDFPQPLVDEGIPPNIVDALIGRANLMP